MSTSPKTLFEKIWDAHVVAQPPASPAVLYIDLHLVHEVTSPQAFSDLRVRGLQARRPDLTKATIDHAVPTRTSGGALGRLDFADELNRTQIRAMEDNCRDFGIELFGLTDDRQGIVHVIGPELGLTQPGKTIVCGDSHTATHGALGALAFGIGTSEVEHVLATQCLLQRKPKTMEVRVEGQLEPGVTAKDIILALIGQIGVGGGTGCVIEYTGSAIRALSMEERMTICNMTIEAGARAGMVAPDETTYAYLAGRPFAPQGAEWDAAVARWRQLPSDPGAIYDRTVTLDAASLVPVVTFGTNPGMVIPISGRIPQPADIADANGRATLEKSLIMGLTPGESLAGRPVNVVFIGSCTNGRIADLRQAARMLRGRQVAAGVRVLVVPGSQQVKRQAEAEGLDVVFKAAGAEWREPGCSMCLGMNGDTVAPGQYAVSTSNRNFEGRQGPGSRTFLASPLTAAAAAITGCVTDPRELLAAVQDEEVFMEPFKTLTSRVIMVPVDNVDTDQIIPAAYLKATTKTGLSKGLFSNWRYLPDGSPDPAFALNRPENQGDTILLAGDNFGCGSSREHAPWALTDFGFHAVISTSFADIFRNNSLKNGLLPVILDPKDYKAVVEALTANPQAEVIIELAEQALVLPDGRAFGFPIDEFSKTCLLEGVDELGYLLKLDPEISRFEQGRVSQG